jgi:hypothetical protein
VQLGSAAALVAGVSAVLAYGYRNGNGNDKKSSPHEIPSELLSSPYGREIKIAVDLALSGT